MKTVIYILVSLILLITACSPGYDNKFYEKVSHIEIPKSSAIIETFDNSEFLTITSFRFKKSELNGFLIKYQFRELTPDMNFEYLWGRKNLTKYVPEEKNRIHYLYNSGQNGKTSWLYIADTISNILWAEIQYPHLAGD